MSIVKIPHLKWHRFFIFVAFNSLMTFFVLYLKEINIDVNDILLLIILYYITWGYVIHSTIIFLQPFSIYSLLLVYLALVFDLLLYEYIHCITFGHAFKINSISSAIDYLFVFPFNFIVYKVFWPFTFLF